MKSLRNISVLLLLSGIIAVTTITVGEEKENEENEKGNVAVDQLPPAIQKSIKEFAPNATISEVEKEHGAYEVELKGADGSEQELVVALDGTIIESEKAIKADDLPEAIRKTLTKVLPGGEVLEVEEKMVTIYSIEKKIDGQVYEVEFDAAGNIESIEIEHEDHED